MDLKKVHNIYFLGIGGIGMSALAHYFHQQGKKVSGYDRAESVVTRGLEEAGMKIFYTLDESHIKRQDLMIYTPAISRENEEYVAAEKAGIPILKRAQALGAISQNYQTLAIAGTHGKTTTSSMLAHLLRDSGMDCTAFLGGLSRNLNGNFAIGQSSLLVVEADEFDRSFLTLKPDTAVITSMDPDHLDIYGTADEMAENYRAFGRLANHLVVHHDLKNQAWEPSVESFGLDIGDFQACNLRFGDLQTEFDFVWPEGKLEGLTLGMPGRHNVLNMTAALALSLRYGAPVSKLKAAVASFSGIYRRFEQQFHSPGITYIDDYAHHPTEIAAAMDTARRLFPDRQLVVVFQPHLFSRTRDFAEGFQTELAKADALLLLDIYPAREAPIPGVNSAMLLGEDQTKKKALVKKEKLVDKLQSVIQQPTILLSLGAGDIDREVAKIREAVVEWAKG